MTNKSLSYYSMSRATWAINWLDFGFYEKESLVKVNNHKEHSKLLELWLKAINQVDIEEKLSWKNKNYVMLFLPLFKKTWASTVPKIIAASGYKYQ